ncbi:unnamed protein product [Darwinula stevensoni]|uniref:Trans-1,2-dihydrobenzene-1,2-diol dehydrogenase n=1 Tax=Darwinula stevensoni TaxID=69355 RepID=A0A7R8X034_9CRUS|nr:unnamed protein product [Darwinula stevensoni]CAG0880701.1 unnamed protein product [Darwinula stevensoni]
MATRWGIVSAGRISKDFTTALAIRGRDEHEVVAVAARKREDAERFVGELDLPHARVYGSYEDLCRDSNVEVVYVGSINTVHFEVSKMALDHGKAVICEKPLGLNLGQTKEIIQQAREKQLFLMEAMWSRCNPVYRKLAEEIRAGAIGEVMHSYGSSGAPISYPGSRVREKELGGSAVLDIGIYPIQASLLCMGDEKPTAIMATGHTNDLNVDEVIACNLQFKNGRSATLDMNSTLLLPNEFYVAGTKGIIKLSSPIWGSSRMESPNGVYEVPKVPGDYVFDNAGLLAYEADEVRRCLCQGLKESPLVPHSLTLLMADIMEEIRNQIGAETYY